MKRERRVNKYASLLIGFFILFFLTGTSFSQNLNQKTLQDDIKYYKKTISQKKLSVNDKFYILSKIEEKYRNTDIDLTPLKDELAKLRDSKKSSDTTSVGKLLKISPSDSNTNYQIIVNASNVKRYNYFVLRDPDPKIPPKIILDLYGIKTSLKKSESLIKIKNSIFTQVQAGQFEEKPIPVIRIIIDMKTEKPYKIKRENDKWIISSEKPESEKTKEPKIIEPEEVETKIPPVTPGTRQKPVPKATSPESENYTIETGDLLGITVYPAEELSRETVVQADGKLSFPLIGVLQAKGRTTQQLEKVFEKKLERFITNPQVTVSVRQFSRKQIFITGEIRSVGAYTFKENMRLLEFISTAGGFTEKANRKEVKVYRGPANNRNVSYINVEKIMKTGDFSKDFLLEPGDIIEVPKGKEKISILGDIKRPGYYDYKENLKLVELISLAGGFTNLADISKVNIVRKTGDEKNQAPIKVNLKKILSGKESDVPLKSGDTIYVPKKPLASANWFVSTVLPWLSLISLIIVLRGSI